VLLLALFALLLFVPIVMRWSVTQYIYSGLNDIPKSEVALVLGASVVRGAPSPLLADRADAAVALYKAGKVSKILVTGDNGASSYDEVTPVRKYLVNAGIPAADIFLDHAGFDTYSSMYRARAVFQATSVIIVTQDFHLPRALWTAQQLGLRAYGVAAEGGDTSWYEQLREIPASLKAVFDVLTKRQPKYIGSVVALTGDGQSTW
jgi:SanA protein